MKKIFLFSFLLIAIKSFSQEGLYYKCKNEIQKDSISSDLKSKGYVGYECEKFGLYLCLQSDDTFCFKTSSLRNSEMSLRDFYSNVKGTKTYDAIEVERQDWCSDIEIKTDKYTDEVSYNSPDVDDISFLKFKRKGVTNQYVSISVYDTYLAGYNNYGLIILFKSGKKLIRKNEKVDVNYSTGSNWRYSVFFTPTANEIILLKNDEITGVKLYLFDSEISQGDKIKQYAKCVLTSPKTAQKKKK